MTDDLDGWHWCGEPISDMSRDELLDVFRQMARMHNQSNTPRAREERVLGAVEWLRRTPH